MSEEPEKSAPATPPRSLTSTKPKAQLTKSLKIPSMKNLQEMAVMEESLPDEITKPEGAPVDEKINEAELHECWNAFALKRREMGKENQFVILSQGIKLAEDNSIHLKLTSSLQVEMVEDIKTELLQLLRSKLRNDHITITYEITEEKIDSRPYTQMEKYEFLVAKQPALKALKEKLGLDYEF